MEPSNDNKLAMSKVYLSCSNSDLKWAHASCNSLLPLIFRDKGVERGVRVDKKSGARAPKDNITLKYYQIFT